MARVLVLGAYGLIGSGIFRHLEAAGHQVSALGRDAATGHRVLPKADWQFRDLDQMRQPDDWRVLLQNVDFVVNCSGALQASRANGLNGIHHELVDALAKACAANETGLIQISAVGASPDATTDFMASKGRGDAAIRQSDARFWILKPGLVLSNTAYGGSQLLRMIAAFPLVLPIAMGASKVQTVSVDDISACVLRAIDGKIQPGSTLDLVEDETHSLEEVILTFRDWLGFPKAIYVLHLPQFMLGMTSKLADILGVLGWRSPLRSNALVTLQEGVTGVPDPKQVGTIHSLEQTLASMPARLEDRLSARMALLLPVVIFILSVFWFASGVIGFISIKQAADVLVQEGWSSAAATSAVAFWSVVDIALGCLVLVRRWAGRALLWMIAVSCIYLLSATVLTPHMWLDPLGPLVKVLPAIGLALVARAMLETR